MRFNTSHVVLTLLLLACFFGFFALPFNIYSICSVAALLAVFAYLKKGNLTKKISGKRRWLVHLLILFLSGLLGYNIVESFKYVFFFSCILISAMVIKQNCDYKWYYCFVLLCLVENVSVILQFIIPDLVNKVNMIVLPTSLYASMMNNYGFGSYAGIAADLPNAMFFSMSLAIFGLIMIMNKKKKLYLPSVVLGIIGVFLSGKRSGIVILVIIIGTIYLLYAKKNRKLDISIYIISIFITLFFVYLLYYTDIGQFYFLKNDVLNASGDLSNGRAALNAEMFSIFLKNPILGIGSLATDKYYGSILGHNIFLQTLSENGILGFTSLILVILLNLRDNYRKLIYEKRKEIEPRIYFQIYIQVFFIFYGLIGNPLYGAVFLIPYLLFSV